MCYMHMLVEENLTWAKKLANQTKRQLPRFIDIDDLQSAAYIGLVEAASRFIPELKVKFTTFAHRRVVGAIFDYLRSENRHRLNIISLSTAVGNDGSQLGDMIESKRDVQSDLRDCLDFVSNYLGQQAKLILEYYMLDNYSMKEIGQKIGLTESRVSQLITSYKKKLQTGMN